MVPQLSNRISQVLEHVLAGRAPAWSPDVIVMDGEFMHRQAFGTTAAQQYSFFNVAEQRFVTDLPGNGSGLPNDYVLIYTGVSFDITTGIDGGAGAAADTDGSQFTQSTQEAHPGTAQFPFVTAEQVRRILNSPAYVELSAGGLIDRFVGLTRAPAGGGVQVDVAIGATTTAGNSFTAAKVNNGSPVFNNIRRVRPQLILPGRPIKLTVDFPSAYALTANGVFTARLHGTLIRPRA